MSNDGPPDTAAHEAKQKGMGKMDSYSFREFLDSVKDLNLFEMDRAAAGRRNDLDRIASSRKRPKFEREKAAHMAAQIRSFRFWTATGGRPAGLDSADFALIEPLCRKLVETKQLKPETLNVFARTNQFGDFE